MQVTEKQIYRILDANINRVKEGLRVVEDLSRFVLNDSGFTAGLKQIRHEVKDILKENFELLEVKLARATEKDVGKNTYTHSEAQREEIREMVIINMQRVEEALRVLEEFSKILNQKAGLSFKNLRYRAYILEKDILTDLVNLEN